MPLSARILVKICGLTTPEDAAAACEAGADFIGVILAESPRRVTARQARSILEAAGERAKAVGVFVNEDLQRVAGIAAEAKLDAVQLHGTESPEYLERFKAGTLPKETMVIKAFRVQSHDDLAGMAGYAGVCDIALLDTFVPGKAGGTGKVFDWQLASEAKELYPEMAVGIAGGLTPGNVAEVIRLVSPVLVDVSGGVESSPGIKDRGKIRAFIEAARSVPG